MTIGTRPPVVVRRNKCLPARKTIGVAYLLTRFAPGGKLTLDHRRRIILEINDAAKKVLGSINGHRKTDARKCSARRIDSRINPYYITLSVSSGPPLLPLLMEESV